jgi:hypothetical protein
VRHWLTAISALLTLLGCATQQVAISPEGRAPVCAAKAGEQQNYWNERTARLDGAVVMFPGECPTRPNADGGGAGM